MMSWKQIGGRLLCLAMTTLAGLLPAGIVVPFAVLLPWVELATGILLVLGVMRRAITLVLLVMLVMFMVAIGAALARGIDIACGCFDVSAKGERLAWETLGRDLLLIVVGLPLLFMRRTTLELARGRPSDR